jgi:acyl carrier protein
MTPIAEISATLRSILINELFVDAAPDDIQESNSLRNDLGLDSLGFVELKAQCERRFGILISKQEFSPTNFSTVASVAALVSRKRS